MPAPGAKVRIVEDDVVVVRYSELVERIVTNGEDAKAVAASYGFSATAVVFHLHKMGIKYDRRSQKWVKQ